MAKRKFDKEFKLNAVKLVNEAGEKTRPLF
jgi:transposase-like protein